MSCASNSGQGLLVGVATKALVPTLCDPRALRPSHPLLAYPSTFLALLLQRPL